MSDVVLLSVGHKGLALTAVVGWRYQPATEPVEDKPGKPARLRVLTFARGLSETKDSADPNPLRTINEALVFVADEADQMLTLLKNHAEQPA